MFTRRVANVEGKVAVANPNNPSELIWVEAKPDANGNLVPVDPRYSVRRGFNNGGAGEDSMSGLLLLGVGLFIVFKLFSR
jgi:hypothetical protein